DKLALRFVLRDENLELMDAHLTNGGRAIPVVLVIDRQNGGVIAKWGPRPAVLQSLLADWRKGVSDPMVVAQQLHAWYAKDKTQVTQEELTALMKGVDIKS
ncbi:MAG: thioredoxin family protein, partial [Sphingobacteriales bacterium]